MFEYSGFNQENLKPLQWNCNDFNKFFLQNTNDHSKDQK